LGNIKSPNKIRVVASEEVVEVVDVLCESFFDYPVMRFVLGELNDYPERLRKLISFFVMDRVLHDAVLMGVDGAERLSGAAVLSFSGAKEVHQELNELSESVWDDLGKEAQSRYEAFGKTSAQFEVETPHIHLNMIGVRRTSQGEGLGRALMDAVHDLSARDDSSMGVKLTTEVATNKSLYEHLGYQLLGSAKVGSTLTTWGLFRADP